MKRFNLLISIFLSVSFFFKTSAQNELCDSCKRVSFSICPTEMISGFETMYIEYKFSNHISLSIGAGHIYPLTHSIIEADEPVWSSYNGTIIRAFPKYYFDDGYYLGILCTYKDLYYSWQELKNACGKDSGWYYYTKSETASLFGIAASIGHQHMISKRLYMDFFCGIGASFRIRDYTIHSVKDQCRTNIHDQPQIGHYEESKILFSMPMGFKLGYTL